MLAPQTNELAILDLEGWIAQFGPPTFDKRCQPCLH